MLPPVINKVYQIFSKVTGVSSVNQRRSFHCGRLSLPTHANTQSAWVLFWVMHPHVGQELTNIVVNSYNLGHGGHGQGGPPEVHSKASMCKCGSVTKPATYYSRSGLLTFDIWATSGFRIFYSGLLICHIVTWWGTAGTLSCQTLYFLKQVCQASISAIY